MNRSTLVNETGKKSQFKSKFSECTVYRIVRTVPLNLHIVRRPQEEKALKNKLKTLYFQFWMIAITEMNCI